MGPAAAKARGHRPMTRAHSGGVIMSAKVSRTPMILLSGSRALLPSAHALRQDVTQASERAARESDAGGLGPQLPGPA